MDPWVRVLRPSDAGRRRRELSHLMGGTSRGAVLSPATPRMFDSWMSNATLRSIANEEYDRRHLPALTNSLIGSSQLTSSRRCSAAPSTIR